MNLTAQAREGYSNPQQPCPYLRTSPSEMAWSVGRWMAQTGRSEPWDCRTSRGATMHINNMKVCINYIQGCTEIERIS